MSFTTIIWFLFIFCLIVISHEFGHYIIAKLNGIRVIEFTIGVGPKIVGFHKNGTYYVLRWIPFGGACIFDGMVDGQDVLPSDRSGSADSVAANEATVQLEEFTSGISSEDKEYLDELNHEKSYGKKFCEAPVWARISTVLAGPVFNFILAYIVSVVIVWFCGSYSPTIHELMPDYPAAQSGLADGDLITKINGSKVKVAGEIGILVFLNKEGKPMDITYQRDGQTYTTTIVPKYSEEDQRYYLGLTNYGEYVDCENINVFKYAAFEVRYCLVATVRSLGMLLSGKGSMDDLAGPVGMAQMIGGVEKDTKAYGFFTLLLNMLNIAMFLSVNLGIMNLLPIPAIDGGRLWFLLIEALRGKPVPPNKEGIVHLIGIILLVILMIVVLFNDIMRFFR